MVVRAPAFPEAFNTTLHAAQAGPFLRDQSTETEVKLPERLLSVPRSSAVAHMAQPAVFPLASVFRRLVDATRQDGAASPSFAQAVHVEDVLDAAYQSMETRQWIRVRT